MRRMRNKRGNVLLGIILFAAIIIGMLLASPIFLKFFNTAIQKYGTELNKTSPVAADAVLSVKNQTVNYWQDMVLFLFFILVLVLFVTSLLIDVHPFFIVVYIVSGILLFAIMPASFKAVYAIYESPDFATEVAQIPALEFLVQNFWYVMLGIYALSGIIIFIKIKFLSGGVR